MDSRADHSDWLWLHRALAGAGTVLVTVSSILGSGFNPLSLPFALWGTLPYAALWFVGRLVSSPWPLAGAGATALVVELGIRGSVFVWPTGSTAAVALVFSPAFVAFVAMPGGAVAGWLCAFLWRWHMLGRAMVLAVVPAALGLIGLGLARPELFPTTVWQRRAAIERIGPPRVVTGDDRFVSVPVTTRTGWYVVADFDGRPGDELAVVDHAGADIHDVRTPALVRRLDFEGDGGQVWGAFSSLVRRPDDTFLIVDTGGGFSETRVRGLDGRLLWEYRPDPTLPPDALRPADLDGDGQAELYGASNDAVERFDLGGTRVWTQPARLAHLVALLPSTFEEPAWVVGVEHGRAIHVWNAEGQRFAERPHAAGNGRVMASDSFAGRVIVEGDRVARGTDLAGTVRFEVPLGDFRLADAVGVRLALGEPPALVLVGTTDPRTARSRLLILTAADRIVYDEVLAVMPRPFVVTHDDAQTLVVAETNGVRAIRPR